MALKYPLETASLLRRQPRNRHHRHHHHSNNNYYFRHEDDYKVRMLNLHAIGDPLQLLFLL
jgi:hypothetical protein